MIIPRQAAGQLANGAIPRPMESIMNINLLHIAISQGNHPMAKILRDMITDYETDIRELNRNTTPFATLSPRHAGPVVPRELSERMREFAYIVPRGKLSTKEHQYRLARIAYARPRA